MLDIIDKYENNDLPEKWLKKIKSFANAREEDNEHKRFGRAMFFIGRNIKQIRKDMGVDEENE